MVKNMKPEMKQFTIARKSLFLNWKFRRKIATWQKNKLFDTGTPFLKINVPVT